jgi:methionyl aminopeptidase
MVNEGSPDTQVLEDGWTVTTRDGSRSAHFEHTVAITPDGPEVLTLLDGTRQEDWLPTAAQRR